MAAVTVRIKGFNEVNRYIKRIVARTPKQGMKLTKRLAEFIMRSAKQRVAPLKSGTGALMESIEMHKSKSGYVVSAGKGLPRPYAYYQEFGFAPHPIKMKHLSSAAKTKWSFLRKKKFWVHKNTPYMGPAFRMALKRLNSELNRTANKIVR